MNKIYYCKDCNYASSAHASDSFRTCFHLDNALGTPNINCGTGESISPVFALCGVVNSDGLCDKFEARKE